MADSDWIKKAFIVYLQNVRHHAKSMSYSNKTEKSTKFEAGVLAFSPDSVT